MRREWEPRPRTKKALNENALEMMRLLKWMTRSPRINGPVGTTAYLIGDGYMTKARELIARLEAR